MRLFFAILPGRHLAGTLHGLARPLTRRCRGRLVPQGSLHLTLAFLGEVAPQRLDELRRIGSQLPHAAGAPWQLDQVGSWHGGIVWAGASQPCPALDELAAALRSALAAAGFGLEQRAYLPHVTLLRHARQLLPTHAITPLAYPLRRISLMASTLTPQGAHYRELAHWP
ncbi:RNA 2',3'-cyclic phosphodiesterase [Vogesella sp. LIG4]|uniref:RNA 2',3'-cyclic phosphodiesterase n=1 Tax=Vogesella sp. LIG4 TaxID=1192162 RepID=UPI0008202394|nr:RNA 2',3'-cyclic phosphodiesterase [Vogesella sp. LIG4]SCK13071.1 2'-5' RNA ligase [Vogesella sp. LIG4]